MKIQILTLLLLALLLISCDSSTEPLQNGKITGKVSIANSDAGIADLELILIDKNAEIDTTNYENSHCFVDTVLTDQNGNYSFTNLKYGTYIIYPNTKEFGLKSSTGSNTPEIDIIDDETKLVDFEGLPIVQGGGLLFTIKVKIKNPGNYSNIIKQMHIDRRSWVLFIPVWDYQSSVPVVKKGDILEAEYTARKGYTAVLYTLDNYFKFDFGDGEGYNVYDDLTFKAGVPLANAPDEIIWEFDASTKEITRIQ